MSQHYHISCLLDGKRDQEAEIEELRRHTYKPEMAVRVALREITAEEAVQIMASGLGNTPAHLSDYQDAARAGLWMRAAMQSGDWREILGRDGKLLSANNYLVARGELPMTKEEDPYTRPTLWRYYGLLYMSLREGKQRAFAPAGRRDGLTIASIARADRLADTGHEKRRIAFLRGYMKHRRRYALRKFTEALHRRLIQQAFESNRRVHPEILEDYPDIRTSLLVFGERSPWRMRRSEWAALEQEFANPALLNSMAFTDFHKNWVQHACECGWDVPQEVLLEYPDLIARFGL